MSNRDQYICFDCVTDRFLSREIKGSGEVNTCMCCNSDEHECWEIEELAERVKGVFDENYELTASNPEPWEEALMRDRESSYEWQRDGESPASIVNYMTGLPEDVCAELVDCWDSGTYRDYKDPDYEDPYGSEACYAAAGGANHSAVEARWREIQDDLHHRSRFFSRSTGEFLNDMFGGVQTLKGFDGEVVETLSPETFKGIYRGRTAYDESEVRKILEGIPGQLGALRGRAVRAGRMNAAGVTVMYGALEEETCIAEVRAPVGSLVVTGKFDLLRPIRVLNLKRLERCYEDLSLFDPNIQKLSDRMAFLRSLSRRLSVPVFNHEAHLDYLATQCIAEYIAAMEPRIDGVAFASAQAGDNAMNLVLFDDACHVAPLPHPAGTKARLLTHYEREEEEEDEQDQENEHSGERWLTFDFPAEPDPSSEEAREAEREAKFVTEHWDEFEMIMASERPAAAPGRARPKPTLVLDLKSIQVHRVRSVKYDAPPKRVFVSERTSREVEDTDLGF
ncbi:RES family NAD+ phosphorylase [Roseateles amylovorans]|uniref:RES family NAD+ phosphorylase n=1 Tax=Roseateles amylovorans TaxID=2978473 RepID=A0ABY6ASJ0_9BURK|nr:RES family NAD+ phosphorylase [Roseateles amylovorans]UXH76201.1 RES family NAD+ phosphorylase [Roseateles amylovorans]